MNVNEYWSTPKVAEPWMEAASCPSVDPEIFFPVKQLDQSTPHRAKLVCSRCEVKAECLEYALANNEYGIWGGTSEDERRRLRKARKSA